MYQRNLIYMYKLRIKVIYLTNKIKIFLLLEENEVLLVLNKELIATTQEYQALNSKLDASMTRLRNVADESDVSNIVLAQ